MADERSSDPAAIEALAACEGVIETAFDRAASLKPCPIGGASSCCRVCAMGPCRLVGKTTRGICGATRATVAARNLARAVAAGSSAHSDHGRGLALALLAVAKGEAQGYRIRDEAKLRAVAGYLGIAEAGRSVPDVALEVAEAALAEFGKQTGELRYLARATPARQALWREKHLAPAESTAKWWRRCTARTWGWTRTPSTSWTRYCAPPSPTAGAGPCWAPISATSSSAPPARCRAR